MGAKPPSTCRARIINDTNSDSEFTPYFLGLQSCIYVPILTDKGKLLGILVAGSREKSKFDKNDLLMLEALANQTVVALQNAKMQEFLAVEETKNTLGDITGDFTHKVNNNVGAIRANADMIEDLVEGQVKQSVQEIIKSSDKILDWVNDFHKSIPERAEGVDVIKTLGTAIKNVDFHKDIIFTRNLSKVLPLTKGGDFQIQGLIVNLIQNAVDAMPEGGELKISAEKLNTNGKQWIELSIAIEDTGISIHRDRLDKIFQRGFTTKKDGLGYGLWWNKNYLERLGGSLEVRSKLGEGSSFRVLLPVKPTIIQAKN